MKINKEKLLRVWSITRNITTVLSIIMFITIIVVVIIISTHKMTLNIEQNATATTVKNIPLQMPITFYGAILTFSGNADVVMSKATPLPVRIKLNVPLDIINILDQNQPISITFD